MTTTKATWTDPAGTLRTGELLDSATVDHPQRGRATASLYRDTTPVTATGAGLHLELYLHTSGKTVTRGIASEEAGREAMATFRGSC